MSARAAVCLLTRGSSLLAGACGRDANQIPALPLALHLARRLLWLSAASFCAPSSSPNRKSDGLFVHWGSASGEKFKQMTSVERWLELAKTHPMVVGTWHACSRRKRPAYDERGRAVGGEQSEFGLSLSLARSGKALHVGMSTKDVDDEELVALWWWCPHASGRSPREILAARRTRLDLREVDADEVFPPVGEDILEEDAGAAAAGAASGAPEGPPLRKIVQARGFDTDASLSGSNSSSSREVSESEAEARAESERSGSDAEGEDSRGAAAGALPSDLGGKSADDAAQTSNVRRASSTRRGQRRWTRGSAAATKK